MRSRATVWAGAVLLAAALVTEATEFGITLPPTRKKCFGEHLSKHVLYKVSVDVLNYRSDVHNVVVTATDPATTVFSESGRQQFKTAFTSVHAGPHFACVANMSPSSSVEVYVNISWGADAKDYDQIAKKDHLDSTTKSLTHVEDILVDYHRGLLLLRSRQTRMQQTNEATARRLMICFVANLVVVGVSATAQVLYFRNFFRSKKII